MLNKASQDCQAMNAENLRDNFIPQLAQAWSEYFGTEYKTELQQLLQTEQQHKLSCSIKWMRKQIVQTPYYASICHWEQPKMSSNIQEDLEHVCITKNDARFSQSSNTPFVQPPWSLDLDFLAETQAANQILQGTYDIPETINK